MKNIYVGNLPYQLSEDELRDAFSQFGDVSSVRIIKDRYTDRSKGFGFVEMSVDSEAEDAIKNLDGQDLKGRALRVNEARPRDDFRPRRQFA
ncbi:MAG: RNA recognition motif domain-containing protein [Methylohalobius sp. ZOD2]|uniref:RNA recognition motif domain-containing protein n=1 Tax=Methylohalobius crimeensis TaxID=244365 RepID=UPI0003B46F83|nr:RNA-binding protein [Methylohalobius crimeensis]MBN2699931.1 RNA-binding protein [Methylothermaceae bacterium]